MDENTIRAVKNETFNEPHFLGHFPGAPVMPGVLIVEAMAQAGVILLLQEIPDPDDVLVMFMGIDKVRFRRPVLPGDQLRLECEVLRIKSRTVKLMGRAYVDGQLAAEGEFMATVQPNPRNAETSE